MAASFVVTGDATSRTRMTNAMLAFLEALKTTFPECQLCADAVTKFNLLVVPDPYLQDEGCRKWLAALASPLPAGLAKYAPPLERLIGRAPVLYHAVCYKDGDTLIQCGEIPLINGLRLQEKWERPDFSENRHVMLAYVDLITRACLEYAHVDGLNPLPEVPTREQINQEIERFAAEQRSALPSEANVPSAFAATLGSIAEMIGSHSPAGSAPSGAPPTNTQLQEEWEVLMRHPRFTAMCDARDAGAIACLESSSIPAFARASDSYARMDEAAREELWTQLNNLVSFSTVAGVLPPGLRGKIENVAAKLAEEIQSGVLSLNDLNPERLMAIGNSVLAGTTQADMEALAGQMDKLLPAVGAMSRNNAYIRGLSQQAGLGHLM